MTGKDFVVSVPTGRIPREYAAALWPSVNGAAVGDTHVVP